MALMHSTMMPLGTKAPDFDLLDTDSNRYSLESFKKYKILTVIFMCNHCPYVQAVLGRLIDLQNEFLAQGVRFIGINSNDTVRYPDDSIENMKNMVMEKKISFPYLIDETQKVAKSYDAVCTPDIFVYGSERALLYRGRIDDNWKEPGQVTQQDLKSAIDLILDDQTVFKDQIPSMGCSIKWKV